MKDKLVAALLALFLGGFGIHRFYLGQIFPGIIYLLFCWTFIPAVVGFIDGIIFLVNSQADFDRKYNQKYRRTYITSHVNAGNATESVADEIAKFHKLMADGIITEQEFEIKKQECLTGRSFQAYEEPEPDYVADHENANRESDNIAIEIEKLHQLMVNGIISEREFERRKKDLL